MMWLLISTGQVLSSFCPSIQSSNDSKFWLAVWLRLVSTGIGDYLQVGIPPRNVTKPTQLTQPCIPLCDR